MADLVIQGKVATQLQALARRQQRPVEALLQEFVAQLEIAESDSAPGQFLRDEAIAIPADISDPAEYRDAIRALRPLAYERARDYWARVGDEARLALTNRELDEQFWVIDPDGIPRLQSDQTTYQLPPDLLEAFVNLCADSDQTDASITTRETLSQYFRGRDGGSG